MDSTNKNDSDFDPRPLLVAAAKHSEVQPIAETFLRKWNTSSHPVELAFDDGCQYIVKGRQVGRAIVNDQITARLGFALGAPVAEPRIVQVPQTLIDAEPQMSHMQAGLAHGTRRVPDCSEQLPILHTDINENRSRFALLAVLYGWIQAADIQLIYLNSPKHLVYSVDHGHFFPSGPNWQVANLTSAPKAEINSEIQSTCGLKPEEIDAALLALQGLETPAIINAVASPPDEWGLTLDERAEVVKYLVRRRSDLLLLRTPATD